jgi:hypothetical protein
MTLSEFCKSAGLDRVTTLLEESGLSREALRLWAKNPKKHKALDLLIRGCLSK